MGQQQLLLVILVTIIVGIATVVAINTFGTAADQANTDAVTNDVATLASSAQGYFMRPEMLGGGSRSFTGLTFDGLAFPASGISGDNLTARNENGVYVINVDNATQFTVTAHPASCDGYSPGTISDVDGEVGDLIGDPGGCDEADQIIAEVGPNDFDLNPTD